MFRAGTKNPWFFSSGFNMMVDFCVWVLETDGLQVAPFDRHPAGDGALRARGFDAPGWRAWVIAVVAPQTTPMATSEQGPAGFMAGTHDPAAVWQGAPTIGTLLAERWEQYAPLALVRRAWERPTQGAHRSTTARPASQRLWDDLAPYHARIPPLHAYLVDYLWPVDYLVPPAAAILGIGSQPPDDTAFRDRVLSVAEGLAHYHG